MSDSQPSLLDRLGFALVRVIVPLWVLAGAGFKLVEGTSKNLPRSIISVAGQININLDWLLATLIALEIIAAGIMIFVGRWARPVAVAMLSMFCLILIAEVSRGEKSCGCFGSITIPPIAMLAIDGTLLLGCVLIGRGLLRGRETTARVPRGSAIAASLWSIAGAALSFSMLASWINQPDAVIENNDQPIKTADSGHQPANNGATQRDRVPQPLPSYYLPDCASWVGKKWSEIDLAQYMKQWPADVESGKRYIVFYQGTCEHCHELLESHFSGELSIPTTAIRIPEKRDGFELRGTHPMPCSKCEMLQLPTGCDWVITTPILVALENGVVICAKEGDEPLEPECLTWGPAGQ
jgi:hypothetical protein